jgi:TonB family protein
MMPEINGFILAVSSSLAASILAKATVVIALSLMGSWLARRNRAAVRHVLLAAAFGVLIALPLASLVAPPVRLVVQSVTKGRTAEVPVSGKVPLVAPTSRVAGVAPVGAWPSTSTMLLMGWIAGVALFQLPVVIGLWQVRSMRRSGLPWRQGQLVADGLSHRRVEVLLHDAVPGAMTCGLLHPAIVLPQEAESWDAEDLNRAIVHELEHVRRGDWVSHCIARAVCAMYWFHPLVWMMWRRFAVEAERACDDAVLGRSEATAYADQLVGLARQLSSTKAPFLAMASRADLSTRVGAVLDGAQRRGRAGKVSVGLACVAAFALVAGIAPLRMVAAPQEAGAGPVGQFMARSSLVMQTVTVLDRNGLTIENLTAADFALTEDGQPQKIIVFEFHPVEPNSQGLQSYYLLGYYANPNGDGHFRKIEVAVKNYPQAKLDYRAGYYVSKPASVAPSVANPAGAAAPRIDADTRPPVLVYKVEPDYSTEARQAKYQGSVVLTVEVDINGIVTHIHVQRSLGLGLDEKAIEAVKRWRFKPGTKNGQPTAMQTQVNVDFRLL